MNLVNDSERTFVLNRGVRVRPGNTHVDDDAYQTDTLLNEQIDDLVSQGKVSITGEVASLDASFGSSALGLVAANAGVDGNEITFAAVLENPLDEGDSAFGIDVSGSDITLTLESTGFAAEEPEVPAVAASLVVPSTGANNDLTFTAKTAGVAGNALIVKVHKATVLQIDDNIANTEWTINYEEGVTTALDVVAACVSHASLNAKIAVAVQGDGSGVLDADTAFQHLALGSDEVPLVPQIDAHILTTVVEAAEALNEDGDASDLIVASYRGAGLMAEFEQTPLSGGVNLPFDLIPSGSASAGGRTEYRRRFSFSEMDGSGLQAFDMGLVIPAEGGMVDDTFVIVAEAFPSGWQLFIVGYAEGNEFPAEPDFSFGEPVSIDAVGTPTESIDQESLDPDSNTLPVRLMLVFEGEGTPDSGLLTVWTGTWT